MAPPLASVSLKALPCILVFAYVLDINAMRVKSRGKADSTAYSTADPRRDRPRRHTAVTASAGKTILAPKLVHTRYTQQFEVKEDYFIRGSNFLKKYKFELEQYETDGHGKKEIDVDKKLPMLVEPHMFTVKGRMSVQLGDKKYYLVKQHVAGTNLFGHYTWRVIRQEDDKVLFTIQKRKWNKDCKFLLFKCKTIWKIYDGKRGDKSSLIYYGVGDANDQDEPDFKFYNNEAAYVENKKKWIAKIEHKKTEGDGEDEFKVKVKPNQDSAIFLLATVCLDQVADAVRAPEK